MHQHFAGHRAKILGIRTTSKTTDGLVIRGLLELVDGRYTITQAGLDWLAANMPTPVLLCRAMGPGNCFYKANGVTTTPDGGDEILTCDTHHHKLTGEWRSHCARCSTPIRNVADGNSTSAEAWVAAEYGVRNPWRCTSDCGDPGPFHTDVPDVGSSVAFRPDFPMDKGIVWQVDRVSTIASDGSPLVSISVPAEGWHRTARAADLRPSTLTPGEYAPVKVAVSVVDVAPRRSPVCGCPGDYLERTNGKHAVDCPLGCIGVRRIDYATTSRCGRTAVAGTRFCPVCTDPEADPWAHEPIGERPERE